MAPLSANRPPALALKLRPGARHAGGLEIIDTASGQLAALIPPGELASIVELLFLASPDLLWATIRAGAHLNCEESAEATAEQRKVCKLLREAFHAATELPAKK